MPPEGASSQGRWQPRNLHASTSEQLGGGGGLGNGEHGHALQNVHTERLKSFKMRTCL